MPGSALGISFGSTKTGTSGSSTSLPNVLTSALDFVDLAAVYGVDLPELDAEIPVAALTLRPGAKLDPRVLRRVVERGLKRSQRPLVVRIVDELPMTAGYMTRKRTLRDQGLGLHEAAGETLWLAPGEEDYLPLSLEDLSRLSESV
jgi:putative long chain acyl-CoA synthase